MIATPELTQALDLLCARAEEAKAGLQSARPPRWAQQVTLDTESELFALLIAAHFLDRSSVPVATLRARFDLAEPQAPSVARLALDARRSPASRGGLFFAAVRRGTKWLSGPRWEPPRQGDSRDAKSYEQCVRIVELAAERVTRFAADLRVGGDAAGDRERTVEPCLGR